MTAIRRTAAASASSLCRGSYPERGREGVAGAGISGDISPGLAGREGSGLASPEYAGAVGLGSVVAQPAPARRQAIAASSLAFTGEAPLVLRLRTVGVCVGMSGLSKNPDHQDGNMSENPKAPPAGAQEAGAQGPAVLYRRSADLAAGLYIVSTPIGNLRDMTLRALDVLASADAVYAEDSRRAAILLAAYGLPVRPRIYHEHNAARVRPQILADLEAGARIALISDAGTPLVSDPGFKLVREAVERGLPIHPVPGASAVLAALAKAGLPTDRFLFAGFPPSKASSRRRFLEGLRAVEATLILFEGPSRLAVALADMAEVFGAREACVCRELTKRFEEARRGSLEELARAYAAEEAPLGELVIVIGPPPAAAGDGMEAARRDLEAADPDRSVRDLAAEIARRYDLPRRDVYELALQIRRGPEEAGGPRIARSPP